MSKGDDQRPTDALEWFLRGFLARDLAEPLLSLDAGTLASAANTLFAKSNAPVIGVRNEGKVVGWIDPNQLLELAAVNSYHSFDQPTIIADAAPLNDVICSLSKYPILFVRAFGQVCGVIPRAAVEKPPVRMWLFGLITISEQRVTQFIEELLPNDAWQEHLSAGRVAKARELQELRRQRGQLRSLLDCLQFADKGQIVARNEMLRERTRFNSRSEVERFVQALQDLRNNLAHAQDIAGDWGVICELAANVRRIICGRAEEEEANGSQETASELSP